MGHTVRKPPRSWHTVLLGCLLLSTARADVVNLKSGEQLGGADTFVCVEAGHAVIVGPSGIVSKKALGDVASMMLEGLRKVELNNGDVVHVENVVSENNSVSFRSDLLGEHSVPVDSVVSVSPPAGKTVQPAPVQIEKEKPQPPKKWSGNVQFGYAGTTGREDTQNANLGAEAVRETEKTRLTLKAAARYGETDGEKDVDAQEGSGKFDYFLTERVYWYSNLGVLRDSINLIDLRLSPGVGVGRKFITGERFLLEGEAGVTMIWERQSLISGEKETESNWYGRVAGRFKWKISDWAEFAEELEVFPGLSSSDEFRYRSISQLTAILTEKLSLATGFTVDYDNSPPEGVPRTSTNASTGLIYNF